jgi:hypothetical protein
MPPIAFASLAVYGAAAALLIGLAHRFVLPVRRRIAILLAAAPLLFTGRAIVTGGVYAPVDILYNARPFGAQRAELRVAPDRTPAIGDVVYQMIPWQAAVRRAVAERRWPLWNPSVLAGEPLLAAQQGAVFHPGTWIGMALPLPQAWTLEIALRFFLALLGAYLFLRDLGMANVASLLGAAGWAFCDFLVFFVGCPLAVAAAPLPLLFLGARRLVRQPGARAVALLVTALLLVVTAGHPETALHTVSAAALYFFFELAHAASGGKAKPVRLGFVAGALALGLGAAVLWPLAEAVPQTREHALRSGWYAHAPRSVRPDESLFRLLPQAMPYAVGVSGHGRQRDGFVEPSAYAGALLFPFAFAGLFARSRERWFFLGLGAAALGVCVKTFLADWIAKLPLFDIALNERLVLLAAFALCVLAALGANRLRDGDGAFSVGMGALLSAGGLAVGWMRLRPRLAELGMPPDYARERFVLQIVPVLLVAAVAILLSRRQRSTIGLAALVVVFVAARVKEAGGVTPTMPAATFYPPIPILAKIPRGEPFRMTALDVEFIPNYAAVYGLEDVRGYETMTLDALLQTYPLWCAEQAAWFNRVDDPTTPFLSFLNVRWVLARQEAALPEGWKLAAESDGMRLFENPRALPRAFAPRFVRAEPDPGRRLELMKSIGDFRERGVVSAGVATGEWAENGEATVEIAAYGAQAMELDVAAGRETLVGTSVPAWRGWRATVDGRPVESLAYNHAFLAFRVPEGRHRLSLCYSPDGFRHGLALSAATLLVAVGALVRLRR